MAKLKPCPFCGGEGRVYFKDKYWGGWNGKGDRGCINRLLKLSVEI